MARRRLVPALAVLALLAAAPALADGCDDAAWDAAAVAAALNAAQPLAAEAPLSRSDAGAFLLGLAPQADVAFAIPPERAPRKDDPKAGTVSFAAGTAGTYRVALSGSAWIDVVADGRSLPSAAFVDFTDCPGLHKIVAFDIAGGPFVLQVSDAEASPIAVAIIPTKP